MMSAVHCFTKTFEGNYPKIISHNFIRKGQGNRHMFQSSDLEGRSDAFPPVYILLSVCTVHMWTSFRRYEAFPVPFPPTSIRTEPFIPICFLLLPFHFHYHDHPPYLRGTALGRSEIYALYYSSI